MADPDILLSSEKGAGSLAQNQIIFVNLHDHGDFCGQLETAALGTLEIDSFQLHLLLLRFRQEPENA